MSFFAHPKKTAGDLTHYGEALRVATLAAVDSKSSLEPRQFAVAFKSRFNASFAAGGEWTGYVDHATQQLLKAIENQVPTALDKLEKPAGLGDDAFSAIKAKAPALAKRFSGDELQQKLSEEADGEAAKQFAALAAKAADEAAVSLTGGDDVQMPSFPLLIVGTMLTLEKDDATALDETLRACKLVQNNDEATMWLSAAHTFLRSVALDAKLSFKDAAQRAIERASDKKVSGGLQTAVDKADHTHREFVASVGKACYLRNGVPEVVQLLVKLEREHANAHPHELMQLAVEHTIFAGGDSPPRAMMLAAILGARHGVQAIPALWVAKTKQFEDLFEKVNELK